MDRFPAAPSQTRDYCDLTRESCNHGLYPCGFFLGKFAKIPESEISWSAFNILFSVIKVELQQCFYHSEILCNFQPYLFLGWALNKDIFLTFKPVAETEKNLHGIKAEWGRKSILTVATFC